MVPSLQLAKTEDYSTGTYSWDLLYLENLKVASFKFNIKWREDVIYNTVKRIGTSTNGDSETAYLMKTASRIQPLKNEIARLVKFDYSFARPRVSNEHFATPVKQTLTVLRDS